MKNKRLFVISLIVFGFLLNVFNSVASAGSFGNNNEVVSFEDYFRSNIDWSLEYKRFVDSPWIDGDEYLTIERTWNGTCWKFNLVFDVVVDVYSARFTFVVNRQVLDFCEIQDSRILINYSNYDCYFDYSDLMSISELVFTHGIADNCFWFRFRRDNIPMGVYEFDPWFGTNLPGDDSSDLENNVCCYPYNFVYNGDWASATDISARIKTNLDVFNVTCGLYVNSTKVLIGQTECKTIPNTANSYKWFKFNFSTPVNLTTYNNSVIMIVCWANNSATGTCRINEEYDNGLWNSSHDTEVWDGTLPNPVVPVIYDYNNPYVFYCNYTITNATVPASAMSDMDDYFTVIFLFVIWLVCFMVCCYHRNGIVILIGIIAMAYIAQYMYFTWTVFNFGEFIVVSFIFSIGIGVVRFVWKIIK